MKFAILRRWGFNVAAAVSLVCCLASAALWARSVGHFEGAHGVYNRWRQADDLQHYSVSLRWYSHTFQLNFRREQFDSDFFATYDPEAFLDYRKIFPAGSKWQFFSEEREFAERFGYSTGFFVSHLSQRPVAANDMYALGVRPFLPTLLAAILPVVWLIQDRRRRGTLWQFGLRELLLSVTAVAALLGGALWLMR